LPVAIARYFNVYGPGEIPGAYRNVIPNFIWWAIHCQPLPITGTGEETRDFTFVDDIITGTLLLGAVPEAVGDAFNLASETETPIKDIAAMVNEITGNNKGVKLVSRRDWDKITRRRASIEKARKVLGYEPQTPLPDGIKKVYDWIVENRSRIELSARF
jgi:UDP-glucose 4-epimerase